MTYDEVVSMLQETELPLAYDHFTEGEAPDPPFVIFLFPKSNNFSADVPAVHGDWRSDSSVLHGNFVA